MNLNALIVAQSIFLRCQVQKTHAARLPGRRVSSKIQLTRPIAQVGRFRRLLTALFDERRLLINLSSASRPGAQACRQSNR